MFVKEAPDDWNSFGLDNGMLSAWLNAIIELTGTWLRIYASVNWAIIDSSREMIS